MKKNLLVWCVALLGLAATACSDDDNPVNVSDSVKQTFLSAYPNASNVEWELKSGYYVADFHVNGVEMDVWYDASGVWCMTETDLRRDLTGLPQAVQSAFQSSTYSAWTVDDIDKYECPSRTFYLIEVETAGQKDRKLYYGETGTLLKDAEDAPNDDVLPTISF